MTNRQVSKVALALALFFGSAGAIGASRLIAVFADRCSLKLRFDPIGTPHWTASCSGHCASSGDPCAPFSIVNEYGDITTKCFCNGHEPITPCDGLFAQSSDQSWIIIQCWNQTCTNECNVNSGFGLTPIDACECIP